MDNYIKNIKYSNREYMVIVNNEFIGYAKTRTAADVLADEYITEQLELDAILDAHDSHAVAVVEPEIAVEDDMTQAAQLCALVDDDDVIATIHTYSVTQDFPALKAEIQKLIEANTLVDTAEQYTQYIRNVNGIVRLTSFIVQNWMAVANEEVGIPF